MKESSLSLEREGGTVPENELSSSSSVFSLGESWGRRGGDTGRCGGDLQLLEAHLPSRETESIIVPDMRVLSTCSSVMVLPTTRGRGRGCVVWVCGGGGAARAWIGVPDLATD